MVAVLLENEVLQVHEDAGEVCAINRIIFYGPPRAPCSEIVPKL